MNVNVQYLAVALYTCPSTRMTMKTKFVTSEQFYTSGIFFSPSKYVIDSS